jgi:hypothetical protein
VWQELPIWGTGEPLRQFIFFSVFFFWQELLISGTGKPLDAAGTINLFFFFPFLCVAGASDLGDCEAVATIHLFSRPR